MSAKIGASKRRLKGAAALRGYERVEVSEEEPEPEYELESLGEGGRADMDIMGAETAVTAKARTGVDIASTIARVFVRLDTERGPSAPGWAKKETRVKIRSTLYRCAWATFCIVLDWFKTQKPLPHPYSKVLIQDRRCRNVPMFMSASRLWQKVQLLRWLFISWRTVRTAVLGTKRFGHRLLPTL